MPQVHIAHYIALQPPYCLTFWIVPSGNPVLVELNVHGKVFIDQIMGDMYTYDEANKLFISTGDIDHDMAEGLQRSLRDKDQKWLKVTISSWVY